jgi:hypothetical protein
MDLALVRCDSRPDGIFSELRDVSGDMLFVTLEHSFDDGMGGFAPKVPDGQYNCVRGMHRLVAMTQDFETFEVTNVPGHTGILFHVGNFNRDSDGCILLGMNLAQISGQQAIASSKAAFQEFMQMQVGFNNFSLTVKSS